MSIKIQGQMMRGAAWMVLFQLVDRALGMISVFILMRLLSPADFGIVAMGMSFVAMAEVLTAFGFDVALIQHPNPTDEHYHSAWTCNVIVGCAITIILIAVAWPAAMFYRQPVVFWVMSVLALGPFLTSLENIGLVRFRKELQFRKEFTFRASRRLLTFLFTLPLALLLRNYWALVGGILISRLGGSVLSYVAQEFRPRFCLTKVRELFVFSKWLLANNIVYFFRESCTDFVVGRLRGPGTLGLYNVSYEIAKIPTADLSASINRALLPGFAKIESGNDLRAAYGNAIGILVFIAIPAAAGVFSVAPYFVAVALGDKWWESTALLEILVFNGAAILFHSSTGALLMARGYPKYVTMFNCLYVLMLLGMLVGFLPAYGVVGAAYAALVSSVLMMPISVYAVKKKIGIAAEVFARAFVRPVLGSILMIAVVRWVLPTYERSMSMQAAISLLIGGAALGIAVYASVVWVLWVLAGRPVSAEHIVLARVRNLFSIVRLPR